MVQKAKLDTLENLPEIEIISEKIEPEVQEEVISISGEKWAFNKLLFIGAPVLLVVLVIAGAIWFFIFKTVMPTPDLKQQAEVKVEKPEKIIEVAADTTPVKEPEKVNLEKVNSVYFKDFMINLKDKTSRSRILMCDVVFDLNDEKNMAQLENNRDIRNVIYQTAKGKNAVVLKSIEERKRLKKEISQELDKMLGDGIVKNVYFTNFVIM